MPEKITLEQLAQMVQRGFEHTARKKELENLRSEMHQHFDDINRRFQGVDQHLDVLEYEVKEIKATLDPLVKTVAVLEMGLNS